MKNNSSFRYFLITILNIIITIAEFIGGIFSGSLALLSDALHNLSDVGSIVIGFIANLIAKKPRNTHKTFGYQRAEILAAFMNGIILIVISAYLIFEGIQRFTTPEPVNGSVMLVVSVIGLLANLVSILLLFKDSKNNLNAKATFLNMLSDALSSVGVVVGAVVISIWQVYWLDPIITIVTSIFLLKEAYGVTKKAINIMLESNPGINLEQVRAQIISLPQIEDVHHIHVWQYSDNIIMLDAHINVSQAVEVKELDALYEKVKQQVKPFNISHVTLQPESININ